MGVSAMLPPGGLPPPVSPFRPNLGALELDVSDDEDGLDVDTQATKLQTAPIASPAPSLGLSELGTPPTPQMPSSDDTDSTRPSPRPRASTLAQSSSSHFSALPPLSTGRQFLRTASQPVILSPTQEQYSPDSAGPPRTVGTKRVLVPSSSKIQPSRPLSEITPLTTRKPLLSASAGKFLSRGGTGRISPPRRVLVKDQREEEAETEDEERAQAKHYPIAPRTSERNNLLRPRKDGTPEPSGRALGRSMSSPDGLAGRRPSPPSPIDSPITENPSPIQPQMHPLAQSSAATGSTSSLASTASSLRGTGIAAKAKLKDWKASIGSWSKGSRSRPPIPGMAAKPSSRPSLENMYRALSGGGTDSARPSMDSLRESFDRPSLDTVRPALGANGNGFESEYIDRDPGVGVVPPSDDEREWPEPKYETEDPEPLPPRGYVPPTRGYEPRSMSAAGWNPEHERDRGDRPGTSSGYYGSAALAQSAQVKSVQNHHEHVRRSSDTLRPSPLETPPSKSPLSSLRHKRSPTAPSPPTATIIAGREKENRAGQTWAAGQDPKIQERADAAGVGGAYGADVGGYGGMGREEGKVLERERERLREVENRNRERGVDMRDREMDREMDRERERELRPASSQGLAMMPPSTVSREREAAQAKRDRFICNKQEYTVVDCIGRGGSSKVYKVISPNNKIYALKRVRLDSKVDEETMRGYVNEMQLLKRLDGNERIIKLIDSQAVGRGGRYLMMVMELGEIDLAKLLQERQGQLLQPHWIAIYWQQMLEAVQTIHDEKIVHSDLKPANFVLVKGSLKLIDFGIAKAIANDTTNIQREHQVGTLNYMSPESIEETQTANGRRLKLGRASDVWSLGCILYQMIYGRPPFYSITGAVPKLRAISDPNHVIDYPAQSIPVAPASDKDGQPRQLPEMSTPVPPDVVDTLRGCLTRDPKQRRTIPELLDDPWLRSWRHTSTPAEVPRLKDNEAIINEAWLKQVIEHASREAIENGALDEEAVSQMAQNLLPALRLANTKHPAYKQFC